MKQESGAKPAKTLCATVTAYDPDDQHDCYRKALNYIKNELILEPYSNACAVLEYVLTHFNCIPLPLDPNEPGIPGDLDDDWDDDGGTDPDPGATDGPYDEEQRRPIWWYHTDHLGSSTYLTDNFGRPSHYYETLPFGEMIVEHNQSSYYKDPYPTTNTGSYDNKWKFNGKELDDATGMYYYGARYYDPRISIFVSVDPLVEETMTPYQYVSNNPIMRIDPTGMNDHDYKLNKDTGSITLVRETNDDFDRILETDDEGNIVKYGEGFLVPKSKKGQEKVAVDNIAKGILKEEGLNLKRLDGSFKVNGENQPTLKEFDKFISEFSDYIRTEIAGIRLGNDSKDSNVTEVKTYRYRLNTRDKSSTPVSWFTDYGDRLKSHFHTHPYHDHKPSENADIPLKNSYPNLPFYIISGGYEKQF